MPQPVIPEWLRTPDYSAAFSHGTSLGTQIAHQAEEARQAEIARRMQLSQHAARGGGGGGSPRPYDFAKEKLDAVIAKDRAIQEAKAKQESIRFEGAQKYQRLISSGMPIGEALAQAGPEMFYNDPKTFAGAIHASERDRLRPPRDPKEMHYGGKVFRQDENGEYQLVLDASPPKEPKGIPASTLQRRMEELNKAKGTAGQDAKALADIEMEQGILNKQIQQQLNPGFTGTVPQVTTNVTEPPWWKLGMGSPTTNLTTNFVPPSAVAPQAAPTPEAAAPAPAIQPVNPLAPVATPAAAAMPQPTVIRWVRDENGKLVQEGAAAVEPAATPPDVQQAGDPNELYNGM